MNTTNGYCECGCGKKTNISKKNDTRWGHKKGEPVRFLPHHRGSGRKKHSAGYWLVLSPDHPNSHKTGYIYEHILVAEEILGKPLSSGAVIHHDDGDSGNNHRGNLVICQSHAHHMALHRGPGGYFVPRTNEEFGVNKGENDPF